MMWPRRCARSLLAYATKAAPAAVSEWAEAMLHELEFVEGEWAALFWALGCAWVMAQHAALDWMMQRAKEARKGRKIMGKKAGWLVLGAVCAVALSLLMFGFLSFMQGLFPESGIRNAGLTHLLGVIVIPLCICVVSAVWLWRRVRPAAVGILLSVAAMSAHVVVYYTHHGHH